MARNLETKLIVLLVDLLLSGVEHLLGLGPQKGLADHSQVWLFLQHIVRSLLLVDDLRDVFHLAGCLHHLDLFLSLLLECRSAFFTLLDDLGDVRDQNSDHNLESDDQMLHDDGQDKDVSPGPVFALVHEPSGHGRLFLDRHFVQVLEVAHARLVLWVPRIEQDSQVDRNGKIGDELEDGHPVADTARLLSMVALTIPLHDVELDLDLQQISQEGEQRSKWERHCKEGDEAHLDDSFIIVEH